MTSNPLRRRAEATRRIGSDPDPWLTEHREAERDRVLDDRQTAAWIAAAHHLVSLDTPPVGVPSDVLRHLWRSGRAGAELSRRLYATQPAA